MSSSKSVVPADAILANTEIDQGEDPITVTTSMDSPKRVGMFIFFLVFGVGGLWAGFAPLDGAAYAPGSVTVRSYKKVVQHLEGGIVADILVRDGDRVAINDPILILDDTQSQARLQMARSQFIAYKAREARLIAERDHLDQIDYPNSLSRSDPRVEEEIAAQNEIFTARRSSLQNNIEILEQRIEQLNTQVDGFRALRETKEQLAESFADELSDTQTLLSRGFSDVNRLRTVERNYATYRGDVADLTSKIAATEVQIGETRLQILQQQREMQNQVVNELAEVQTTIKDLNEQITALEDIVRRTTIRATESGFINGMQVHTIGGVIAPGTPIAEIVPTSDDLILEANVAAMDIDRVSVGQEAMIRFSTFGNAAPTTFGTVFSLSADSITDQNTGAAYYLARIEVSDESLSDLNDLVLMPGMPAEVFINTGSRTFLQYIFKPFSNAMARSFNED